MNYFFVCLALAAGLLVPLQTGINAELARRLASSVWAAGVSFVVGSLGLMVYLLARQVPWPGPQIFGSSPWWVWCGGLLGALYVFIMILAAPKLGAATLICLTVAGQMLASLIIDHWGLVGFELHPASWGRILGAILLIAGVVMIQKF